MAKWSEDAFAPETVTITREEYDELLDAQNKLGCLEAGGVDNWEGYSEALREGGYWDDED